MNVSNVRKVYQALWQLHEEGKDDRFSMAQWYSNNARPMKIPYSLADLWSSGVKPRYGSLPCGTAACLAGWAQIILAETPEERSMPASLFAKRAFGLSWAESDEWFRGIRPNGNIDLETFTLADMLDFLEAKLNEAKRS
jgi:hypothetical protein